MGIGASNILSAAGKATAATGPALSRLTYASREGRKQLKRDVSAMKAGQLGMSEAQKRQMVQQAVAQQDAATRSDRAELLRGVGAGQSGTAAQALQGITASQASTAAQAGGEVAAISQQVALQRKADILRRLREQEDRNREDWVYTTGKLGESVSALGGKSDNLAKKAEGAYATAGR